MEIKLYNTKSPTNKIGKNLENETVFECRFKNNGNCDIINPTILIQNENFINFNYAYIDNFKRYYFVNDIVIFPNNIFMLSLNVDVLESYKNSILKNKVHITQKENSNMYGADIKTTEKTETIIKNFEPMFKLSKNFVLVTSRGGVYNANSSN